MNDVRHPYKILFVEDEKEVRDNYTRYLKRHFLNVYEAIDGEEGYRVYKDKKPDIMILDINLPRLNGLELLKKIREHDQTLKVIMLTAHADSKYLFEAVELKLVKYLVKPITRQKLKDALDLAILEYSKFNIISKETMNLKDGFVWDKVNKILSNEKGEVALTQQENKIIELLLSTPNKLFTYDDIVLHVWDSYEDSKQESLKTLVKNVRKKLPSDTIKNIFGLGYKC